MGLVSLVSAEHCRRNLTGVMGFEPPVCVEVRARLHIHSTTRADGTGWQHEAVSRVDRHFRDSNLMPRLDGYREGSSGLRVVFCRVLLCLFRQRVHTSNRICSLLVRRLRLPLPGLLLRGTESHWGMTTHSDLWRTSRCT